MKKLLLTTLASVVVISSILVGCNSKEESKVVSNTTPTSSLEASTNEEETSVVEDETTTFNEETTIIGEESTTLGETSGETKVEGTTSKEEATTTKEEVTTTKEATTTKKKEETTTTKKKEEATTTKKEVATTTKKEEETTTEEVVDEIYRFYEMPDYEKEWEYAKPYWTEEEWDKMIEQTKEEYRVAKLVFRDLTKKFLNKELLVLEEDLHRECTPLVTSIVCDVPSVIPDDVDYGNYKVVFDRRYTEFKGFDPERTFCNKTVEGENRFNISFEAIAEGGKENWGWLETPMCITLFVRISDNGDIIYESGNMLFPKTYLE